MRLTNLVKTALWAFTILAGLFFLSVPRLTEWMEQHNDAKVAAMGFTPSSVLMEQGRIPKAELTKRAAGRFGPDTLHGRSAAE
ncbi:MAG: hypothetical protein COW73_07090 [Nitrospirae bacterium CG18_big_fil_WC_8_21_14_2_50_70_55]|nr:hypothetical protein [Deltaproteobacteria bacterium]OIP64045.1 MAG: hypothetical protein AUK30_07325 [Nitrospirae bacterium CG2_30_70_394]PIQ04824.1 MAG: hypothetical protein COW73_07090 [Nitrospirae bacterium CG18_big_fil_WC_8_21_14_2_50_70_55]PIU77534.1 MAG: hypothetical protein COS73_10175 [Nitrospirae bacterium CG06_land_8_20_14_3_00_70_43]PIW84065.1 MAG: hypothetical protein COZ96_00010 [Nitrospirae bacterium CG_4_8_14_3_um_filter_70_85]PIX83686.1 MAG: hypothetical protein COZ33_04095 